MTTDFKTLYEKAYSAGCAAALAAKPATMVVTSAGGERWVEPEGMCGFAWVKIRPGNSPFARWLKKTGKVRGAAYNGGVDIWISDYNQSYERKRAHADAMAEVLRDAGITAFADSRLD